MTLKEAAHKLYEELGGVQALSRGANFAVGEGKDQLIVYGQGKRPATLPEQYEGFPVLWRDWGKGPRIN